MNVDVDVEGIAKDAVAEAGRIAADETAKRVDGEAGNESTGGTDGIPAAGALGTDPNAKASVAGKAVVGDDPSTSKEAPSKQASQGWRQLIRLHPGNGQHWSAN